MDSRYIPAMIKLEWKRCQVPVAFITGVYLITALMAMIPFAGEDIFRVFFHAFYIVMPLLAGLVLGAGVVADDIQQGTILPMLAQPVSRTRIWLIRTVFRTVLLILVMCVWRGVFRMVHQEMTFSTDMTDGELLLKIVLSAGLIFAMSLAASSLMRSSFEAAIAAAAVSGLVMSSFQFIPDPEFVRAGFVIGIFAGLAAAWNLFACREPLEWRAMRVRAAAWMAGICCAAYLAARMLA